MEVKIVRNLGYRYSCFDNFFILCFLFRRLQTAEKMSHRLKLDRPDKEFEARASDSHHWGITVNLEDGNQTICYCCSLPLFSKSLIKEDNGGIMVFSCGHTYHTVCLKNKNCTATCLVCDRFLR